MGSYQHLRELSLIDRLILVGVVVLVSAVLLIYSSKLIEATLFPRFLVLTIFVFILTISWLIKIIRQKEAPSFATPLALPILFFAIINIASLSVAVNLYAGLFPLAQLFTLSIFFLLIYNNLSINGILIVIKAWALVGALLAIIGICQYLGIGFYGIPSAANPSSTFTHRNIAAMFLILTIPVSGFLFLINRRQSRIVLWGLITALLTVYLIYTRTRGAWVGMALATIITLVVLRLMKRYRLNLYRAIKGLAFTRTKVITGLFTLLFIVIMATLKPNIKHTATLSSYKSEVLTTAVSILKVGKDSGRWGVWRASWDMLQDNMNWLSGVGLNNWHFHYPYYAKGHLISTTVAPFRPHNDFIWILTETGVVGLGIYFWLLLTTGSLVYNLLKHSKDPKIVALSLCLSTSLVAILGHSLFSFPKDRVSISLLFWLVLGFIARLHTSHRDLVPVGGHRSGGSKTPFSKRTPYWAGVGVLILFVVVAGVATEVGRRHLLADYHYRRALIYPIPAQARGMIAELEKAERYWPHNWRTAYYYGVVHYDLGQYSAAISHYQRCLTYSPHYLNANYNLGLTYYQTGDYKNALKYFLKSIQISPSFVKAHYNLGLTWHKLGNLEEAGKYYRLSLNMDPLSAKAHNNLGAIYQGRQQYQEALHHFKAALEIDPNYQLAQKNLDSTLVMMKNPANRIESKGSGNIVKDW